jgi:Ca-activated chloride channel family protein
MTCIRIAGSIGLLCAMLTFAQGTRDGSDSASGQTRTSPPLRVDVDLVLLHATVTDSANKYVTGLRQQDFRVWEDKIEQRIEYFFAENVPLSIGIIFDISGSMETKLAPAVAAANTFLRMGDSDDEYFLIQFSDEPKLAQDFTTDIAKLQSRLLLTRAKGSTSLYDALYLGLEKVNRGTNARKALLLITDGQDNHSRYSFSDVREFAREHDVMIYSIGIVDQLNVFLTGSNAGRGVLEELARVTGGAAFFPDSVAALDSICAKIGLDLKNQYVLGYHPLNVSQDGRWRKIRVKVNTANGMSALNVRAKSGYYASALAKVMK